MAALFDVHVVPNSSRAGPDGTHDGIPRLRVKARAADGRANAEAEKALTKLLGARVSLERGGRSRRKTFSTELSGPELSRRLAAAFGRV